MLHWSQPTTSLLRKNLNKNLAKKLTNNLQLLYILSDNKLVKTVLNAAMHTSLTAGIGWVAKKAVKENFTADPSSNAMSYVKFTVVMASAIALKKYLEDQKILPETYIYIYSMASVAVYIYIYSMASLAIMAGSAVLNAVSFIGILPIFFRWWSKGFPRRKKKRHDKTLEAYQVAYVKYEKEGTKLLNGTQHGIKEQAKQYFMNTDYAFKLYNRMYQDEPLILMLETSIGQKPNSPYSNLAMMIPFWNGYDMVEIFLPFSTKYQKYQNTSPQGYWKGITAIKKLASTAKVSKDE